MASNQSSHSSLVIPGRLDSILESGLKRFMKDFLILKKALVRIRIGGLLKLMRLPKPVESFTFATVVVTLDAQ